MIILNLIRVSHVSFDSFRYIHIFFYLTISTQCITNIYFIANFCVFRYSDAIKTKNSRFCSTIGLVLKANKRYSQQIVKAFHVSQATLDLNTLNDSDGTVQVWLNTDDTDHLIANVSKQTSHVQLDLAFTEGETVSFYSKGNGTVHLSGYLIPDNNDFDDLPFDAEEEEEERFVIRLWQFF